MTMTVKSLGNLAVLRTFRVLRALKTVAVVPGKTVAETADVMLIWDFSNTGISISQFQTKVLCII